MDNSNLLEVEKKEIEKPKEKIIPKSNIPLDKESYKIGEFDIGEFKEKNKYSGLNEMKLGYNASAIEYIGEFDLIINKTIFNIYQRRKEKRK